MLQIETLTVGMFQVHSYVLTDSETGEMALVDTGETKEVEAWLRKHDALEKVRHIYLTHTHIDHAGALHDLQKVTSATAVCPRADQPLLETLPKQGTMFGMPQLDRPAPRIDKFIDDGDTVTMGRSELRFLSTPGHTPGQGCYYNDTDIFVGDTLFQGSIGRTDFPLSDPLLMAESLRRLFELPLHLRVHSGHGPVTTLAVELHENPFLGFLRDERGIRGARGQRWF